MTPKWRALFMLALTPIVLARGLAACTDDAGSDPLTADAGGDDAPSPLSARCPDELPVEGEICRIPEGTTCELGTCASRIATCTRGRWRVGTNPPPSPPCPAVAPELGDPCPLCWPVASTCRYGSVDCSQPDASENVATASCPSGTWSLRIEACRDASADAVSDVQDDADAGAD